jgi:hypothetical protein
MNFCEFIVHWNVSDIIHQKYFVSSLNFVKLCGRQSVKLNTYFTHCFFISMQYHVKLKFKFVSVQGCQSWMDFKYKFALFLQKWMTAISKEELMWISLKYSETRVTQGQPFLFVTAGVPCNWVYLCIKMTIYPKNLFVTTECSLTTEFIITEFHCTTILSSQKEKFI